MDTLTSNIPAILTLFGVLLGAALQHHFSQSTEKKKQFEALRISSYVDYLRAVSKFAQAGKTSPEGRLLFLGEAADAKTRICIYGSEQCIKLLAAFERNGPNLSDEKSAAIFLQLVVQMRSEGVGSKEAVSINDVQAVIFEVRNK